MFGLTAALVEVARVALDAVANEDLPKDALTDLQREQAAEACRALEGFDPQRTFGVCVGGAMLEPDRDEYTDPIHALRRAEEVVREHGTDEAVQILLWSDDESEADRLERLWREETGSKDPQGPPVGWRPKQRREEP